MLAVILLEAESSIAQNNIIANDYFFALGDAAGRKIVANYFQISNKLIDKETYLL